MLSETLLRLAHAPYHMARPERYDAEGLQGLPGQGPFMAVYLLLSTAEPVIAEAWFESYGCPTAVACGTWLCRWLEGRTVGQARLLEADDLSRVLGGLPLGKEHCAPLAVQALKSALAHLPGGPGGEGGGER